MVHCVCVSLPAEAENETSRGHKKTPKKWQASALCWKNVYVLSKFVAHTASFHWKKEYRKECTSFAARVISGEYVRTEWQCILCQLRNDRVTLYARVFPTDHILVWFVYVLHRSTQKCSWHFYKHEDLLLEAIPTQTHHIINSGPASATEV